MKTSGILEASMIFAGLAASLVLQGCAVTIESKRIVTNDGDAKLPSVIPGTGITTALVRTRFDLVQPVSWTPASASPVADMFDRCFRTCNENKNDPNKTAVACKIDKPEGHINFFRPAMRSVTVPDRTHVYQTTVSADMFQTSNVTISSAANGTLEDVNAKTSSVAFEVLAATAKAVATALVPKPQAGSVYMSARVDKIDIKLLQNLREAFNTPGLTCSDLPSEISKIEQNLPDQLACKQARAVQSCIDRDVGISVQKEQNDRDKLFDRAVERKLDHRLLAAAVANRTERIANAQARLSAARSFYGISSKKAEPRVFSMVKALDGPQEFTEYNDSANFDQFTNLSANPWAIESQEDISNLNFGQVAKKLEESGRKYTVKTVLPVAISSPRQNSDVGAEDKILGNGFRYRLPITAVTTVQVLKLDDKQKPVIVDSIRSEAVVAQYGPIAAMPSRFYGKGGRVHLKLWPESGGIQTAEIGSDGLDPSTITSVLDKYETEYKARIKDAQAAAFRAGGADATIEALRREKEKLQLQKDIRDLNSGEM
jgi:hypothetical protein